MGRDRKNEKSEQYAPMPYPMLRSEAWRSLSGSSVKVYFELHSRFNGGNNGRLHLSYNEAATALGMGKATVKRAYEELCEKGFIALVEEGNWYHRKAHEWRLTTKPTHTAQRKVPATNEWRLWRPEKTKRGSSLEPSAPTVVPFQNPRPVAGSISEPLRANPKGAFGSKSEH